MGVIDNTMLKSFLLFLLLYVNAITGDLANAEGCKSNNCVTKCQSKWEFKDGHCYLWDNRSLSWDEAEAFCKKEGGHLTSLASLANEEGNFACRQNLCSGCERKTETHNADAENQAPSAVQRRQSNDSECSQDCTEGWEENGQHCYFWSTITKSWDEAEQDCRDKRGYLASVTSNATNEYILKAMANFNEHSLWIGGNSKEKKGVWKWTDGSAWGFDYWFHGHALDDDEEKCLQYDVWSDKKWYNADCSNPEMYLCSKRICSGPPSQPTTTTETAQDSTSKLSDTDEGLSTKAIVGIASSVIALAVLLLVVVLIMKRKKAQRAQAGGIQSEDLNPVYGMYYFSNGGRINESQSEVTDGNEYYAN